MNKKVATGQADEPEPSILDLIKIIKEGLIAKYDRDKLLALTEQAHENLAKAGLTVEELKANVAKRKEENLHRRYPGIDWDEDESDA